MVRFEPELPLQFFERRRSAEGLHADDLTGGANVSFPTKGGGLLHGNARLHIRRENALTVILCLMIENLPGRHRYHARANAFGTQLLMRLNRHTYFAARGDDDDFGISARSIGEHVGP